MLDVMSAVSKGENASGLTRAYIEVVIKGKDLKADEEACEILDEYVFNNIIYDLGLLYGGGDFGRSICLAVQCGFDTDCNGATVGSIVGMMRGSSAVGEEWTAPIHGALATSIFGIDLVTIDQLVDKTMEHLA